MPSVNMQALKLLTEYPRHFGTLYTSGHKDKFPPTPESVSAVLHTIRDRDIPKFRHHGLGKTEGRLLLGSERTASPVGIHNPHTCCIEILGSVIDSCPAAGGKLVDLSSSSSSVRRWIRTFNYNRGGRKQEVPKIMCNVWWLS